MKVLLDGKIGTLTRWGIVFPSSWDAGIVSLQLGMCGLSPRISSVYLNKGKI